MMLDDRHIGADGGPQPVGQSKAEPRSWLWRTILISAALGMVFCGWLLAWSVERVVPVLVAMAGALN